MTNLRPLIFGFVAMPSPLVKEVGKEWRSKAMADCAWEATGDEKPGRESEGFWVRSSHLRGYMKPSKDADQLATHPRAAHEKIAADLAFDLELPVSPAILADGTKSGGKTKAAVVSLVLFREVFDWNKLAASPPGLAMGRHILRTTRPYWSGVVCLDAWLANTDRNDTNLVMGMDPNNETPICEPVFCDFANSMIHSGWTDGKSHKNVGPPPILPVLKDLLDREAAMSVARRIAEFSEDSIVGIVERIPDTHLVPAHQQILIDALLERRQHIPAVIDAL